MTNDNRLTNSIFQKAWWLDAVAPGKWKYIDVSKGGELFAFMPVITTKIGPFTNCGMPPFTQVLGPWIKEQPGKHASKLSSEKELFTKIIEELPRFSFFKQRFHFTLNNWLPFYWNGFNQTTRYTYVLEDISDTDRVWDNMQGNIRREIKKAQKDIKIELLNDEKLMWEFHSLNFDNTPPGGNFQDFQRLNKACKDHKASQMFIAKNSADKVVSAMYIVWDENSAYYLFGGTISEFKNTGAFSLMMFEAIKFVSTKTIRFDFEGSMIEPIERFYRSFGAVQKPYFHITKKGRLARLIFSGKEFFRSLIK